MSRNGNGVPAAELQRCGSSSASPSPPVPAGLGSGRATGSATSAGPGGSGKGERKGRGRAMEPPGIPASLFRFPGARPAVPVLRHGGTAGAGAEPGAGLVLPRLRSRRPGPRGAWRRPHFDLLRVFSSIFRASSPRCRCAARPPGPAAAPGVPVALGPREQSRPLPSTPKSRCRVPQERRRLQRRSSVSSPEIQPRAGKLTLPAPHKSHRLSFSSPLSVPGFNSPCSAAVPSLVITNMHGKEGTRERGKKNKKNNNPT